MVKRILIILLVIVLLAGCGGGAWYFLHQEVTYKGSVENSHTVTLTLGGNTFFDLYIPNEAVLEETDEYSIYRYDLLSVAVQDTEPTSTDFKANVGGKWVTVNSKDNWLAPTLYSFEHNQAYEYYADYEYLTVLNEEGEEEPAVWDDGPAPYSGDSPTAPLGATIYDPNDYLLYNEEYRNWDKAILQMMARLCLKTNSYIPHYYNDGNVFYATIGDYTVGCVRKNYSVQYTVMAKGPTGTREALAILTKGLTG